MIPPTIAHVLLSALPFFTVWGAASFGWAWAGLAGVFWCWFGREFAQSMRASTPLKIAWSWSNTRNLAIPVVVWLAIAAAIAFFFRAAN